MRPTANTANLRAAGYTIGTKASAVQTDDRSSLLKPLCDEVLREPCATAGKP